MAKLTENAVFFSKSDHRQIFVDKVCGAGNPGFAEGDSLPDNPGKKFKKKTILVETMTYAADRKTYTVDEIYEPDCSTVAGSNLFLKGHNALPCQPKSGYDSFVNGQGATNPKSDKGFKADATARISLCYIQALMIQKAAGGANGKRADALLDMIQQHLTDKDASAAATELAKMYVVDTVTKKSKVAVDLTAEDKADLAEFMEMRRKARADASAKAAIQPPPVKEDEVEDEIDGAEDTSGTDDVEVDVEVEVEDDSEIEADTEIVA